MSKPILVLNCGSSSVKYQMIDVETEAVLAKGLVQRIGDALNDGEIEHEVGGEKFVVTQKIRAQRISANTENGLENCTGISS